MRPRIILTVLLGILILVFGSAYEISVKPRTAEAMTLAKAQTVSSAIIGAGFSANTTVRPDGTWQIRSDAPDFTVDASTVCSFATAQGVTAKVAAVLYY